MRKRLFLCAVIGLCSASTACGDDEDSSGGAGCADVQMLCADEPGVQIDCDDWDASPASVKECAGNATTCDAVEVCLFGG